MQTEGRQYMLFICAARVGFSVYTWRLGYEVELMEEYPSYNSYSFRPPRFKAFSKLMLLDPQLA
jgi:hypothetical protein